MVLISVIIPVFNGAKTLPATLASVLQQTFTDFELIIINDGSTDNTLDAIAQFLDPRIQVFSYANAGLATSRNRGIAQASGEFISFIDADDLWTPDKLAAQYQALQAHPTAAVAYSWTNYINDAGEVIRPGLHITANENAYEKLLLTNILESGSNPLIRRQALRQVGEFNPDFSAVADWEMWLRLAACYPFITVPSVQVLYRFSATSMSTDLTQMEAEALRFLDQAFAQAPDPLQALKPQATLQFYQYLTFKALEAPLTRKRGLIAFKYFAVSLRQKPAILRQTRLTLVVIVKILMALLLPPSQSQRLLQLLKSQTASATY